MKALKKEMDEIGISHAFSIEKAHETQVRLSKKIILENRIPEKIRLIAGVDVAYSQDKSIGAVAVLDYYSLRLVESQVSISRTRFPYVPTLLSFREIPPALLSIRKLRSSPDVFLIDGQGLAHPHHCGLASHLGLVINRPTVGVAKSRLFGEVESKRTKDFALLTHKGETVGALITTKRDRKPVYVSVGHMISLEEAIEIVRHCTCKNRIPEPILRAHKIATERKRKINNR